MLKITLRLQKLYSYLLSTANIGSFSQGEPHLIDVNHCVLTILTWRSHVALQPGWVPKPSPAPSAVWTENLLIVITIPSPARLLSLISPLSYKLWYYFLKMKLSNKAMKNQDENKSRNYINIRVSREKPMILWCFPFHLKLGMFW